METKIYFLPMENTILDDSFERETFINEAESLGNIYSLHGFIRAFNNQEIDSENYWILYDNN